MPEESTAALVHSHHLLDHKPDNLLLKGGKYKLRGLACLGRPGVALCIGNSIDIDNFQSSMEQAMPQKKFATTILNCSNSVKLDGFQAATLGELRKVLTEMGCEQAFLDVTGLTATSSKDSGKSKSKKKRK